tara:strand:+ start:562 stop:1110 length:549 start_codon:yes stop_codon:yes gene_type:complete
MTKNTVRHQKIAKEVETKLNRKLTNRQREFAKYYVEGIYSNAECSRKAGFSPKVANTIASHLLSGKKYPQVLEYIKELRQEQERKYGVTMLGQLKRLSELSKGAEDIGQFSASINAEKIRCALGGLTIDRRETVHSLDDMTREDIISRLTQLQKQYPQAFIEGEFEEVQDDNREKLLETNKK